MILLLQARKILTTKPSGSLARDSSALRESISMLTSVYVFIDNMLQKNINHEIFLLNYSKKIFDMLS